MNWSYIAGFIDGEGCILFYRGVPRLTIGQVDRRPLDEIQKYVGTNLKLSLAATGCHYLQISRRSDLILILENVTPELIVKRREAEEALEWCQKREKEIEHEKKFCSKGHARLQQGACRECSRTYHREYYRTKVSLERFT